MIKIQEKQSQLFILHLVIVNMLIFGNKIHGQSRDIHEFMNQIIRIEIPTEFKYINLIPQAYKVEKIYDNVLIRSQINKDLWTKYELTNEFLFKGIDCAINWQKYSFSLVNFLDNADIKRPPRSKRIMFVNFNIKNEKLKEILDTLPPNTVLVKKKCYWKRKNIWKNKKFYHELKLAWDREMLRSKEEQVYFEFSCPIFSQDNRLARITIVKNERCKTKKYTAVYVNNEGQWEKLFEYNFNSSILSFSHGNCNDMHLIPF